MKPIGINTKEEFEKLFAEHGGKILNTVYCMVGNHHDAEDIVQEAFVLAYSNRHKFKGKSHPSTWLYRITMNAVKAYGKRKNRHLRMISESSVEELGASVPQGKNNGIESHLLNMELNRELQKALLNLPLNFREVFVLSCIEGYSYKEIAAILNISIGTVESRIFRARERLRKELSDTAIGGEG